MLKRIFLLFSILLLQQISYAQPCTTTNASGCHCQDGTNNCDLLPDITIGQHPLTVSGTNGVMEYSQSSSTNPGQLRISVETPNIGHGPLHTLTTNTYVCPDSTYYGSAPTTCNDGSAPKTLVNQEIFHKNGSTMTSWQHTAGSMTYHPTHGHMHYDDWGIYTLRLQIPGVTDPLLWPIVGTGAKLGFCLLDYGDCDTYGDCRNGSGPIIHNADFENFGLGGGGYNCTPNQQGISVGWADVYYQYLDGMYITIPPELVMEIIISLFRLIRKIILLKKMKRIMFWQCHGHSINRMLGKSCLYNCKNFKHQFNNLLQWRYCYINCTTSCVFIFVE